MKRRILIIISFSIVIFLFSGFSFTVKAEDNLEEELKKEIEDYTASLDVSALQEFCDSLTADGDRIDLKQLIKDITSGNFVYTPKKLFESIGNTFLRGITNVIPSIISIVIIAVLFSLMFGMTGNFINKQTTEIVYFVCYSAVIIIVMTKVMETTVDAKNAISSLNSAINHVMPVMITLVSALGGTVSASVFQPQLVFFSTVIVSVINYVVLPIFLASVVFSLVGNLSTNAKLEKLTKACLFINKCVLTITFSVFALYISVSGITASAIDGVSIKAAKFMVSSYIPILGGYISQGFDLVSASIILIKNSIGVVGMMLVVSIVLSPIIKLAVLTLGLKVVSGIIEPITDKRMTDFVYGVSESTGQLIAGVSGCGFAFFIIMLICIGSFNVGLL